MEKLYFKYGAMGSSKTAQALITKYNYEENDMKVWLIKPSADVRDGVNILRSRIGLAAEVEIITPQTDVYALFEKTRNGHCDVIIVDECQFMTPEHIDQLRAIVGAGDLLRSAYGLSDKAVSWQHASDGSSGHHPGDQDHVRLRRQGHRQCPYYRWLHRHRRRAGCSGR